MSGLIAIFDENTDEIRFVRQDDTTLPITHYQYTCTYNTETYTKLYAFHSVEEKEDHKRATTQIAAILNSYLRDPDQTPESVWDMIGIFNRYARTWGYLRVPANIRLAVNYKQEKAGFRCTDYGRDSGVLTENPYEIPASFEPEHCQQLVFSVADVVPPQGFLHTYNCTMNDGQYAKYIPCVDEREINEYEFDTRQLYRQMYHLAGPIPATPALINRRRTEMKGLLSKSRKFLHKWGLARIPGNVRSSINSYEYLLSTPNYTDFGADVGVLPGSTPYEDIPFQRTFRAIRALVLPADA